MSDNDHGQIVARAGAPPYFAGEWKVDLLDAVSDENVETPIWVKLGHRDGSLDEYSKY